MAPSYRRITTDGLWSNNIVFAQLLALCPLLAVTSSASNGLGMGLATAAVLVMSGLAVAVLRHIITPEVRIPVFATPPPPRPAYSSTTLTTTYCEPEG